MFSPLICISKHDATTTPKELEMFSWVQKLGWWKSSLCEALTTLKKTCLMSF